MKPPYTPTLTHDYNKVIYGICVQEETGRHYCFNRGYKVLPVTLPVVAVEALKANAVNFEPEGVWCEGGGMPVEHEALKDWQTYFVFNGKTMPEFA